MYACVCMPAYVCLSTHCLATPQYACQLLALNVAVLLYLPCCVAYPPYASGRSLLLYCFRHQVHHLCPRSSATQVCATNQAQAKRYPPPPPPRILQFLKWNINALQCVFRCSLSLIVEADSAQKIFLFLNIWKRWSCIILRRLLQIVVNYFHFI